MHIAYNRNFKVGQSTHWVQVYRSYTDEQGLDDKVDEMESPRMADIFKFLKGIITEEQKSILHECMKEKWDVIVLENGEVGR